jgi:hypothetical protein
MLFAVACLAGYFFLVFGLLENSSATFKVEGLCFGMLFLFGQVSVFPIIFEI